MAQYKILMADSIMEAVRSGTGKLPPGFRVLRLPAKCESPIPPIPRTWLLDVEDDSAPAALDGCLVEPVMQSTYNDDGSVADTWISSLTVIGWRP